ncbi:hypothetical protein K1T71_005471 [Dendrolimus kikuchii]|uniref:Uncharacterized protein n=1 Tax=Dendrolimus kikuchii TaxID=765133 RepID=A0ACC1D3Z5_9NEOP|nr:hypothetical protein K1T71_005471 [Dendrolimus kikuchii]
MNFTKLLIILIVYVMKIDTMAIKGPVLTRYDPCGLGVIHFDKISPQYWKGVVNFGLYSNLVEAEMEIYFEKEVVIYGVSHNTSFKVRRNNWHDFRIKPVGPTPKRYTFNLAVQNVDDDDVPVVISFAINNVTLCNDEIKAAQTINSLNVTQQFPGKPYVHMCGRRSLNNAELTSVRTDAKPGDWPWHVAILIKDSVTDLSKYQCGGNIVSTTAIVTAAHCGFIRGLQINTEDIIVVAGVSDYKNLDHPGIQTRIAQRLILHPSYNFEYSSSDLAIIKVNPFKFTDYVQPICIWGPVYDKTNLFGKEATVVGFGATENGKQSNTLRSTYIMVQNDTTCIAFAPKVYAKLINEFTFCAGYGPTAGINPRNGDSGGGLVVETMQPDHKISWYLRGVLSKCGVSPGKVNCDPNYYVVYTDVGPHYGWIYHNSGLIYRSNVEQPMERQ